MQILIRVYTYIAKRVVKACSSLQDKKEAYDKILSDKKNKVSQAKCQSVLQQSLCQTQLP